MCRVPVGAGGAHDRGVLAHPHAPHPARDGAPHGPAGVLPGLALVGALALVATLVGRAAPVVGGPVVAIVGGVVVGAVRPGGTRLRPGVVWASRHLLQASVVVLGLELSFRQVVATGEASLPVLAGTLAIALTAAWLVGRRLHVRTDLNLLIGIGTAICGASAIAATDTVLGADEADVSYAVATIFTFNVAAVLTFPLLGHALGLSQHAFGLWAGTAVNDTSSVVASTTIYGHGALAYGVVVKLTRTLAIVPICLALSLWRRHRAGAATTPAGTAPVPAFRWRHVVPTVVVGFLVAVGLDSLGLVPHAWHGSIGDLSGWLITAALAAIGLSTHVTDIRRAGLRPLLLGACLWVIVGAASLGLQAVVGG